MDSNENYNELQALSLQATDFISKEATKQRKKTDEILKSEYAGKYEDLLMVCFEEIMRWHVIKQLSKCNTHTSIITSCLAIMGEGYTYWHFDANMNRKANSNISIENYAERCGEAARMDEAARIYVILTQIKDQQTKLF